MECELLPAAAQYAGNTAVTPWSYVWLLGRSQGLYPLSLQPAMVGLFFPLFMVCDLCQQFFSQGVHLNMPHLYYSMWMLGEQL